MAGEAKMKKVIWPKTEEQHRAKKQLAISYRRPATVADWRNTTQDDLDALFQEFDQHCYQGELTAKGWRASFHNFANGIKSSNALTIHPRGEPLGITLLLDRIIYLDRWALPLEDGLQQNLLWSVPPKLIYVPTVSDVLLHEMAHAAIGRNRRGEGVHRRRFVAELRRQVALGYTNKLLDANELTGPWGSRFKTRAYRAASAMIRHRNHGAL
jgi:hypothetical protein